MQPKHKLDAARCVFIAAAALTIGTFAFLAFTDTLSADDYWYSTFWRGGLRRFIELTRLHYETFNGRVLVHVLAQTVLCFGTWLFAPIAAASILAIPFFASQSGDRRDALAVCALFGGGALLLPTPFFAEGFLWISAFFNYVFPTAMLAAEVWIFSLLGRKYTAKRAAAAVVWAFLCGATMEQSGLVAIGIALLASFERLVFGRDKKGALICLAGAMAACLGFATVLLSPATAERAKMETGERSVLTAFAHGAGRYADIALGSVTACAVPAAALVTAGLTVARGKRLRAVGWLLLVPAALIFPARSFLPNHMGAVLLLVFAATALAGAALFLLTEDRASGALILAGAASAGITLATVTSGARLMLPTELMLIAAAARLLTGLLGERRRVLAIIAAAVTLLSAVPMSRLIPRHLYNYNVERENRRHISEANDTGTLLIDVDYDRSCTYTKMYEDGVFYKRYLEYAELQPGVEPLLVSGEGYTVYFDGARSHCPAFRVNGDMYVYMRGVEELGGSLEDIGGGVYALRLGGRSCEASGNEAVYTDENGETRSFPRTAVRKLPMYNFLNLELYTGGLGLSARIDEEARTVELWRGDTDDAH